MSTEYTRATSEEPREALARKIARLRVEGVPWDGPGGIVDSMRLVSSATQGRALLRKYKLDAKSGGPVEIGDSYDRFEINPATGHRKGHRDKIAAEKPSAKPNLSRQQSVQSPSPAEEELPGASGGHGDDRHAPIRRLVRRIRGETQAAVPDVDAQGPGIDATVLIVLRDPGRLGALTTRHLSVMNPDRTAANQRRLLAVANLPAEVCLFWNAIPWDLEGRNPSGADLDGGARYLTELVRLMPQPPIVVACGNTAHNACKRAGVEAIEICHPSDRGLHGGGVDREPDHVAGLKEAARRVRRRGVS